MATIAVKGHVLTFLSKVRFGDKPGASPRPIGINDASVFTGFCSLHDSKTFSCFEREPFTFRPDQVFYMTYRSLAREYYGRARLRETLGTLHRSDAGQDQHMQVARQLSLVAQRLTADHALRDLKRHRLMYDKTLRAQTFEDQRSVGWRVEPALPLACSTFCSPDFAFDGRRIQNPWNLSAPLGGVSLNILPEPAGGTVVISWHKSSDAVGGPVARSLLAVRPEYRADALIRFAFSWADNIYFTEQWWSSLRQAQQSTLSLFVLTGVNREPQPSDVAPVSKRLLGKWDFKEEHVRA